MFGIGQKKGTIIVSLIVAQRSLSSLDVSVVLLGGINQIRRRNGRFKCALDMKKSDVHWTTNTRLFVDTFAQC